MAVSLVSTGVTFPDNTTQTTAASAVTAGNGISVSSGTVAVACPTFNTVGSYCFVRKPGSFTAGSNYAFTDTWSGFSSCGFAVSGGANQISGTWKVMSANVNAGGSDAYMLGCRVS